LHQQHHHSQPQLLAATSLNGPQHGGDHGVLLGSDLLTAQQITLAGRRRWDDPTSGGGGGENGDGFDIRTITSLDTVNDVPTALPLQQRQLSGSGAPREPPHPSQSSKASVDPRAAYLSKLRQQLQQQQGQQMQSGAVGSGAPPQASAPGPAPRMRALLEAPTAAEGSTSGSGGPPRLVVTSNKKK
jgi:hypothetical protein